MIETNYTNTSTSLSAFGNWKLEIRITYPPQHSCLLLEIGHWKPASRQAGKKFSNSLPYPGVDYAWLRKQNTAPARLQARSGT